ncbi:putative F-box protein at3g22650 [Phtheirospermum japonicum]|uniref:Putative F-box protein at3g22650 n=1 Tax=Phtheirospermum japonicum TaxID=374723 RepID=A0A830DKW9_9LAMI|nr:putative F-box protein at3g22650 [Phtheirospermum japonicum]
MVVGSSKQHKPLKLVVLRHQHLEPLHISLLSTEEDDDDDPCPIISSFYADDDIGCPVASCHELLLSTSSTDTTGAALWNPSTKELKMLPQSSVPRPPSVVFEWARFYGFGFDPRSQQQEKDYKVIRFLDFEFEDYTYSCGRVFLVELYSLKTDSWKQIAYPHTESPMNCASIYINGFYYWLGSWGGFDIISFDFANDKFSPALIPGPKTFIKNFQDTEFEFELVEFEGSLAVIVYSMVVADGEPVEFELWVWNNDNESWSRRGAWTVSIPAESRGVYLLGLFNNDKLYFQNSKGELLLFDAAKEKLKNICLHYDLSGSYSSLLRIFPYVGSSAEEIK